MSNTFIVNKFTYFTRYDSVRENSSQFSAIRIFKAVINV